MKRIDIVVGGKVQVPALPMRLRLVGSCPALAPVVLTLDPLVARALAADINKAAEFASAWSDGKER